jgi:beta-phosphoglucomutase family hydrolase
VLFDLDGVLTDTASLHAAAWKETFDRFLSRRHPAGFQPFDLENDYLRYVDGKPRYQGVDSFLRSRDIYLPWGDPDDPPGDATVCAVGNLKNEMVGQRLRQQGVSPYPGSLRLLDRLEEEGLALALVTSSANAGAVLEAAGLLSRFPARVDGQVAADLGLAGKPAPDPFLEAARQLRVSPAQAVVIEDAVSGIAAGKAGGFALVIGVARHGNRADLLAAGADLVVEDLAELV